jgi:hypothetical protein
LRPVLVEPLFAELALAVAVGAVVAVGELVAAGPVVVVGVTVATDPIGSAVAPLRAAVGLADPAVVGAPAGVDVDVASEVTDDMAIAPAAGESAAPAGPVVAARLCTA